MRVSRLAGVKERGADDGLELPDLAGEDGAPDAELAGCVVEAGLSGEGEEPLDALLGAWVGEDARRCPVARDGPGSAQSAMEHQPFI